MEDKSILINYLIQTIESYAKTNLNLFRLKAISTSADVVSSLYLKFISHTVFLLITILFSFGLALWVGDLLGKLYFGFFVVAAFYVLIAVLLHYVPNLIKSPMKDRIILKMLNIRKDEK